ncbi:MAG TPA: ABC transporter substrate-binding protein, partial [Burkholderiaceae bacterium]|nr:ABC transporter substrate-binding protein [Burkholderiaceae bacterium]
FAAEGLEIDTAPVAGGATGIPGMVGGAYDIVFTNIVSAVLARQQNIDLRIIAPGSAARREPPDFAAILVRKGENIRSGADLNGRSFAVNTRNNIIWLYAREWAQRTGADVAKINFREVPFPQMVDALRGKQVDAIFTPEPYHSIGAADQGIEVIAYPYVAAQPGAVVAPYVAMQSFIQQNPDTVRRFAAALRKGAQWVNANRGSDRFVQIVGGYTRLDPDRIRKMTLAEAPLDVPAASIAATMELMRKHGLLTATLDPAAMLHETASA